MERPAPRPPPQVTIVDPNGPAVPAEPPGPWRPTLRQVVLSAVAVVVIALGAGTQHVIRHRLHERALDRQVLADVHLAVDTSDSGEAFPVGHVLLGVRNNGLYPVRLTEVQIELPGYSAVPYDLSVQGPLSVDLSLPDSAPCGPALLDNPTSAALRVRLRTERGQRLTRHLPLTPHAIETILGTAQLRCGELSPAAALIAGFTRGHIDGPTAVLDLVLGNRLMQPLRLLRLAPAHGLTLSFAQPPPSQLPALASTGPAPQLFTTRVLLTVSNCRAYISTIDRSVGPDGDVVLFASVAGGGRTQVVPIALSQPDGVNGVGELQNIYNRLLTCGTR